MLSTPRTASSELLPVLTRNQTRTLLLLQRKAQSLPTLQEILTTTLFGGRALTRILLLTQRSGQARRLTVPSISQRATSLLIRTQDLQLRQKTARAFHLNLKIRRVFRFRHSYSAADVLSSLRWYISQEIGITVYSLALQWLQRQQQLLQAQ